MKTDRRTAWLIFAAAAVLYARTVTFQYALDDRAVTFENRFVRDGIGGIPKILTTFYWAGFWDSNAGLFRPLSVVMLATEWQIVPDAPAVYHAVNVLLYALAAMLLYRVLRMLFPDRNELAIIATLLWIVHPAHTEVVANIKSADEILMVLFALLSVRSVLSGRFLAAGGWFFGALLSKETAIAWLLLLAITLFVFHRREILRGLIPLVAAACGWGIWHYAVIASAKAPPIKYRYVDNSLVGAPDAASRFATALKIQGRYLLETVAGYPQSYDYSFRQIPNVTFTDPIVWVSIIVIVVLAIIALTNIRRQPILSLGVTTWFVLLAPTSNLFVLIGSTMGDRFLFGPTIGFALCAAVLIARLPRKEDMVIATGIIAVVYSQLTFVRTGDWRSDETLFSADVANAPDSGRVRRNYGTLLMNRAFATTAGTWRARTLEVANDQLTRAAEIDAADYEARFALGQVAYQLGDYRASERWTSGSIDAWRAAGGEPPADAFMNRGDARMMLADYAHALEDFTSALQREPSNARIATKAGNAHFALGDVAGAAAAFEQAVKLDPSSVEAWDKLANTSGMLGEIDRSREAFARVAALRGEPAATTTSPPQPQ
jgi:tetratricopeptide (TPR) repeat protein